jgi:chromosome segregation ATPase
MPTVTMPAAERKSEVHDLEQRLRELRDHLQDVKRRLDEEIRSYPTPIPRCDAQFNHLFEQRGRLNQALERIDASLSGELRDADYIELLGEFVRSPAYLDDAAETDLRMRLGAELSRLGH